ncbi:hypothetical protein HNY73_011510 [Argiope bruennichi]|uniref:Endonuclease/exonuclease/phosphatase domain-containing protein n=1 Tax=Argiope bruennichi TaxID=94029 RepID=A0A8T0F4A0_ARGBR|nr:hypothetical protein HNY73_011510 [Argiope bruennichi]
MMLLQQAITVPKKDYNSKGEVSCKEKEFDQLKRTIESNDSLKKNITVRLPGKRLPSLIIYDLPNDTTNKDVQTALKAYTNMQEDMRLRFKMKGRREGTSHWVLETPGEVLHTLKQLKKIPINWSMYQMKEFFHVKRCSTCQAYGHTAFSKECKFTTPFCGCCGYRHHSRSCRSEDSNCINCYESNRLRAQDVSTTLQEIQEIITSLPEEKIIIGADLNGHSTLWGYRSNDNRGKIQTDALEARVRKYHQLSGSHYRVSVRQIIENEHKLRLESILPLTMKSNKLGEVKLSTFNDKDNWEQNESSELNKSVSVNSDDIIASKPQIPIITYISGYSCHITLKKLIVNIVKCSL